MIDEYYSDKKMPAKRKMKNCECNKVLKVKEKDNVLKKTKYVNKKKEDVSTSTLTIYDDTKEVVKAGMLKSLDNTIYDVSFPVETWFIYNHIFASTTFVTYTEKHIAIANGWWHQIEKRQQNPISMYTI